MNNSYDIEAKEFIHNSSARRLLNQTINELQYRIDEIKALLDEKNTIEFSNIDTALLKLTQRLTTVLNNSRQDLANINNI